MSAHDTLRPIPFDIAWLVVAVAQELRLRLRAYRDVG